MIMTQEATLMWHLDGGFYNAFTYTGHKASDSLRKLRAKIYNVIDVKWSYHIVLTFSPEVVYTLSD